MYLSRMFLAMHPFIALGMTESDIASGNSAWIETVQLSGTSVPVPSAWMLYVIFSLVLSAVLLLFVVRAIGPVQPAIASAEPVIRPVVNPPATTDAATTAPGEDSNADSE
jgi:hypothetical protein